jgi:hypothetical protein
MALLNLGSYCCSVGREISTEIRFGVALVVEERTERSLLYRMYTSMASTLNMRRVMTWKAMPASMMGFEALATFGFVEAASEAPPLFKKVNCRFQLFRGREGRVQNWEMMNRDDLRLDNE